MDTKVNQRSKNAQFESSEPSGVKLETVLFTRIQQHSRALLDAFCKQRKRSASAVINDAIRAYVKGTLIDDEAEEIEISP